MSLLAGSSCYGQATETPAGTNPPELLTRLVPALPYTPPSNEERQNEYFRSLVNPMAVLRSAASAGIGQWRDRPEGWGQGAKGYGTRFASAYGGHLIHATVEYGIASALHEDDRYFPSGQATRGARLKYALASTFLARDVDGNRTVSLSKIGGFTSAAFVSRLWQPTDHRGTSGAISLGIAVGIAAGMNVAREFLPRVFQRK